MRKQLIFLSLITLLVTLFTSALAEPVAIPDLNWEFSTDFTTITINDTEYNNVLLVYKYQNSDDNAAIYMYNAAMELLARPYNGNEPATINLETLEQTLQEAAEQKIASFSYYPYYDLISVNHQPWQESDFAQLNLDRINNQYSFANSPAQFQAELNKYLAFTEHPEGNGYAYQIFNYNKYNNLADAKNNYNLAEVELKGYAFELARTNAELATFGQAQNYYNQKEYFGSPMTYGEFLQECEVSFNSAHPSLDTTWQSNQYWWSQVDEEDLQEATEAGENNGNQPSAAILELIGSDQIIVVGDTALHIKNLFAGDGRTQADVQETSKRINTLIAEQQLGFDEIWYRFNEDTFINMASKTEASSEEVFPLIKSYINSIVAP